MSTLPVVRQRHAAAFTLVELLVVISIISLLIAILLPALGKARTAAHVTQSLSNIRQITLSLHMYANDNNSTLPYSTWDLESSPFPTWVKKINGVYVSNPKIYWSPGRFPLGGAANVASIDLASVGYGSNQYGAMVVQSRSFDATKPAFSIHLDRVYKQSMSDILMLAESVRPGQVASGVDGRFQIENNASTGGLFTYDGRVVHSFVDGHAAVRDSLELDWQPTGPRSGSWTSTARTGYPYYRLW